MMSNAEACMDCVDCGFPFTEHSARPLEGKYCAFCNALWSWGALEETLEHEPHERDNIVVEGCSLCQDTPFMPDWLMQVLIEEGAFDEANDDG